MMNRENKNDVYDKRLVNGDVNGCSPHSLFPFYPDLSVRGGTVIRASTT